MFRSLRIVVSTLTIASCAAAVAAQVAGSGPPGTLPPQAGQQPQRPTGTGAISGVVRDGQTGQPIAGALVYVGITGRGPASSMSRQLTDPKGRFVFTDLPESDSFFLNASKAGYADGHYGDTGPVSGGVGSGLVKLTKGQWFRDANIPLFRPAVIAGSVTDETGEPVVGVYVRVLPRIYIAGLPQLGSGPAVRTDDRGRFRIPSLPSGTYLVSVPAVQTAVPRMASADLIEGVGPTGAAAGGDAPRRNNGALDIDPKSLLIIGNYATPPAVRAQSYPPLLAPGVTGVAEALAITVGPGDVHDTVAIRLRPVASVRILGRVDGPEEAVRNMVLRLLPRGLEGLGEGSEAATALVDRNGEFTFLNVPAGQYTLLAQRTLLEYSQSTRFGGSQPLPRTPGLIPGPSTGMSGIPSAPPGTQVLSTSTAGDRSYFAQMSLDVADREVTDLIVPLRRGAGIRGRVVFEGDGDPPGPVAVVAEPADGSAAAGMHQSGGRVQPGGPDPFVFAGLPPGRFLLRVLGLVPTRHIVQSIRSGGTDYSDRPIETAGDSPDVIITITDRLAGIEGTVALDDPARLLTVIAFPADRNLWSNYGMTAPRFKTAPVKNDGSYKIASIPAGDYLLVAVPAAESRRWQDPAFLDSASRVAARVSAIWGQTKSVTVKPAVIK